jgi:indolepyruvate ferredoxin oxidoreductase alpha subunit
MTGHQPHPGTGFTVTGDRTKAVSAETVAKALGADFVVTVDPYDLNTTIETFERAKVYQGLSVVVAKQTCSIIARKSGIRRRLSVVVAKQTCSIIARKSGIMRRPFTVNKENCTR